MWKWVIVIEKCTVSCVTILGFIVSEHIIVHFGHFLSWVNTERPTGFLEILLGKLAEGYNPRLVSWTMQLNVFKININKLYLPQCNCNNILWYLLFYSLEINNFWKSPSLNNLLDHLCYYIKATQNRIR